MELNYVKLVIPVAPGASVPECPPTAWFVSVEVSMNIRNPFMKTETLLLPEIWQFKQNVQDPWKTQVTYGHIRSGQTGIVLYRLKKLN